LAQTNKHNMAYREAYDGTIKAQVDDYLAGVDASCAPDATTELALNHLPQSVVQSLLEHISGNALSAAELDLFDGGAKGLSRTEFLDIWKSDEARLLRLKQGALAGHAPLDVVHHWEKYTVRPHERLPVDPPRLVVPDAEASDAALHGEAPAQGGGRVVESRFGVVRKLGQNWRKAWQPRWLFVESKMGFGYHTKSIHAADFQKERPPRLKKVVPFAQVVGVCIATAENTPGKAKLRPGCFNVTVQTGRTYTFACESAKEAEDWCKSIASHVLVDAVQNKSGGLDRVRAFVQAGGELNGTFKQGKQYPLLATALATESMDVAQYLLSIGADAKCLLRWNFLVGNEGVLTPVSTLKLLTSANYDLNIVGDDCHSWTLLHYLCYGGNLDEVDRILLPKLKDAFLDTPNTIGDTALTLILKTISAGKQSKQDVEPIAIQLAQRCPNINHADSDGDNALHLAIKLGCADLAQVLVEMGADTRVRDSHGNTALHLAIKTQQSEIVNLIASHAARVGVVPRTSSVSATGPSVPVAVPEAITSEETDVVNVAAPLDAAVEGAPTLEDHAALPVAARHIQTPTAGVAALLDQRDGAFGDTALVMSIKLGQVSSFLSSLISFTNMACFVRPVLTMHYEANKCF
jgi:ankyrin repeat protein